MPISYLGRIGNRYRQGTRPRHPKDLDFEINWDHVPDELEIIDITVGKRRHLLIYSEKQLELLGRAKRWFVDGTFKVWFYLIQ